MKALGAWRCRRLPLTSGIAPRLRPTVRLDGFDSEGLMDLAAVADNIRDPQMQYYLCGPVAFMQFAAKQLVELGVNKDNIHYECFGPHKVAVSPDDAGDL